MYDVDENMKPRYEDAIKIAANRHDISVISVYDPFEKELPNVGLVRMVDAESGKSAWVDTSGRDVRDNFYKWRDGVRERRVQVLNKYRVDSVDVPTDGDYVKALISLFKSR